MNGLVIQMSNVFFTSDLHFGHENIIRFDGRPFKNVEEMDEELIKRWNKTVSEEDTVYILGDLAMKANEDLYNNVKQLNGHKILVEGNHGRIVRGNKLEKLFEGIYSYLEVKIDDKFLVLSHFPIMFWNKKDYGSYHFYGHVHNTLDSKIVESFRIHEIQSGRCCNCYPVFCGFYGYKPATFKEVTREKL